MTLLRRIGVRRKLALLTLVILAAFAVSHAAQVALLERFRVGGPVYVALTRNVHASETVHALLGELHASRALLHLLLLPATADRDAQLRAQWEAVAAGVDARFAAALAATDAPGPRLHLEEARASWSGYAGALRTQAFAAPHAGRVRAVAGFVDGAPTRRVERMVEQLEAAANSLRLRTRELERGVERTRERSRWVLGGAVVALALALLGFLTLVGRSITRPLRSLVDAARRVDEGDLTTRLATDAPDELGELSRALDHTVARLSRLLASVQRAGRETAAAVERLAAAADEQGRSVSRQAAAVLQAGAMTEEIRQTSRVAADQAAEVLRAAEAADGEGRAGTEALAGSFRGIQDVHAQLDRLVACVEDLASRSARASAVTDAVKELAGKSNMLALNAAIEATRAGERGAGFKVVAGEIRSLANRSLHATAEVQAQLEATASAVQAAVAITAEGRTHVAQGLTQVRAGEQHLGELARLLQASSEGMRRITTAVSQQHEGVTQVSAAVGELSSTTDDAVATVDAMRRASAELRDVTRQLTDSLSGFRL